MSSTKYAIDRREILREIGQVDKEIAALQERRQFLEAIDKWILNHGIALLEPVGLVLTRNESEDQSDSENDVQRSIRERALEVLRQHGRPMSTREIASELGMSERSNTLSTVLRTAMEKYGQVSILRGEIGRIMWTLMEDKKSLIARNK